ncbi:transporter [Cupriavidus basilensis]|uniref:transporter n=1 Tax=Cupriavidus basilensis TaxID=68895 RepID=UPI0020A632FD|nr:transporter [Cupriavidus basilensis]MCP3020425.1 transporter [Cupriavidus basilensis]
MNPILRVGTAGAALLLPSFAFACATCGCSLSADAAMGYSTMPGWRISFDYSFINQNQLRHGTGAVPATQAAAINDAGGNQEVEKQTINRYYNLGLSYSPNSSWSFSTIVPIIDRSHTTYGNATSDQLTPDNVSGVTASGLGDIKLIGTYQGFLPTRNLGVQLGVKLPTGAYGGQNVATGATVGRSPVFFSSGPNAAAGQALDASLQPGTGSTDLILGAYYYQPVSQNFDAFINGQFQAAVMQRLHDFNADYRPGNLLTVSTGVRYVANPKVVPQLQFNFTHKNADQGALADTISTGGSVLYLSPGVTVAVSEHVHMYAFVQKSIYSNLQGYQLFPRWTGNLGVSYAF